MEPATRPQRGQPRALRALLPFLRPYRWPIAAALVLLLLAAAATLAFPMALRQLIDQGLPGGGDAGALRAHFALLFGVAVAVGVFSAGRYYAMSWLGERVTADLRSRVYAQVLRQSPAFFETTQTGEVLSRLTADATLVQTVIGSSFSMGLRNAVLGVGALVMLVWTNPMVMLVALAAVLVVVLPTLWIGRSVRRLSRASQDRVADASAIAAEVLAAVPVVQGFTAEGREAARFATAAEVAFRTAVRRSGARALLVAFIIIANAALLLWGLYRGAEAVLAGQMSAGSLGQTVVYALFLAGAVAVLGEVYGDLLRAAGAMERLMELLATEPDIRSPERAHGTALPLGSASDAPLALAFDGVTFHYPSRPERPALSDFTLRVAPGETVALVGASGAGKSTVFQLLQRFYDVSAGRIVLGGQDIRQWDLHALRERIATVPQDAVIFSSSALDNIRYARPGASREEVIAAARAAFAHDFIEALPEGYDTFLGERGVRLSGGQRQRIAIARALLKDAPVLLLDEATSALDAHSERAVQQALDAALAQRAGSRITLVIAHRLATVQHADRIVVLEQGRVVEEGRHAELVARGGAYARLARLQFTA
ncbi:ABC transporter transmembrane domain-containing protein [Pulveribacter sp.]|uniref:ABC transporter transmembrane domain-containing protein n=1 Tax=Pulveribacter sp. TaxID=2678893 RepID=UPI0028A6964A|nr:ABC transporter transmembrane domain-containing protein [Pulveribacter sp.]